MSKLGDSDLVQLKSWPQFYQPSIDGLKTSDFRSKADRTFEIGQHIVLCEFDPLGTGYTGRAAEFEITHMISNDTPCALSSAALENDFVVLSIRLVAVLA